MEGEFKADNGAVTMTWEGRMEMKVFRSPLNGGTEILVEGPEGLHGDISIDREDAEQMRDDLDKVLERIE